MVEQPIQLALELLSFDPHVGVFQAQAPGGLRRQRTLIPFRPGILGKGEGERAQLSPRLCGVGGEDVGINPCGQENADGHVGDKMGADAVPHGLAQIGGTDGRHRLAQGFAPFPEPAGFQAVFPNSHPGSRREGTDATVERVGLRHIAPEEIARVAGRFGSGIDAPARQQGLYLGGGPERAAVVGGVEGLDPVRVPRKEQFPFFCVPNRNSEHSAQPNQHRLAFPGIEMKQNLRVGAGPENRSLLLQLLLQFPEVVNLAVKDDMEVSVRRGHRLGAGLGKIQDGEPAMSQPNPSVGRDPGSRTIRAARCHAFAAPLQRGPVHARRIRRSRKGHCNSTHKLFS